MLTALLLGLSGVVASSTTAHAQSVTVVTGRVGDRWLDDIMFRRVERKTRDRQFGYLITYDPPGLQAFTIWWPRELIDFRGVGPAYRLLTYRARGADGRVVNVYYPTQITEQSLPDVYAAIQVIEQDYARMADGAISALEMFGVVASLGTLGPAASVAPRTALPSSTSGPAAASRAGASRGSSAASRASTRAQWRGSLGAGKWRPRVLQTGGRTISPRTARALNKAHDMNLTQREWGRAIESLKWENHLPSGYHGKILESAEYADKAGNVIDSILGYIPGVK